jgi:hypothetical protein
VKAEIKRLRAQQDSARAEAREMGTSEHVRSIEAQLHDIYEKEEIMYKQRSRQDWLRAGDKNTKFSLEFSLHLELPIVLPATHTSSKNKTCMEF